jgi:hypothetical protein
MSPHLRLNTGVYWVKQRKKYGMDFFNEWLSLHPKQLGHDQDGLNDVVRGRARLNQKRHLPAAESDPERRIIWSATNKTTAVSSLPVHLFGNAYTWVLLSGPTVLRCLTLVSHPSAGTSLGVSMSTTTQPFMSHTGSGLVRRAAGMDLQNCVASSISWQGHAGLGSHQPCWCSGFRRDKQRRV